MNIRKKIIIYLPLFFLTIAFAVYVHPAEQRKHNNIFVYATKLSIPINVEYTTSKFCCSDHYTETTSLGRGRLNWMCAIKKSPNGTSHISFYSHQYVKEPKKTLEANNGDIFNVSEIEDKIVITKNNLKDPIGYFTLKHNNGSHKNKNQHQIYYLKSR